MIPFTENEQAERHAFKACQARKAQLKQTFALYHNALIYGNQNSRYAVSIGKLYNQRKAIFYAAAHDYINRYGAAQVF
jgi:hypothetical protein